MLKIVFLFLVTLLNAQSSLAKGIEDLLKSCFQCVNINTPVATTRGWCAEMGCLDSLDVEDVCDEFYAIIPSDCQIALYQHFDTTESSAELPKSNCIDCLHLGKLDYELYAYCPNEGCLPKQIAKDTCPDTVVTKRADCKKIESTSSSVDVDFMAMTGMPYV